MDPIIGGALISAGAGLVGGGMSNRASAKAMRQQIKYQKEFAQHGIRWRVEDAKAAGLHPLYALGANTPSFSPVSTSDAMGPALAAAGQDIGRAVAATQTAEERALTALTLKQALANIARTEAETALFTSEARRNSLVGPGFPSAESMFFNDPALIAKMFGTNRFTGPQGPAGLPSLKGSIPEAQASSLTGRVTPVAPDLPLPSSSDPYTQAGVPPMWRNYTMADGLPLRLPASTSGDPTEALESLSESWPMLWMVYNENVRHFGPEWGKKFRDRYIGGALSRQMDSALESMFGKPWRKSPPAPKGAPKWYNR